MSANSQASAEREGLTFALIVQTELPQLEALVSSWASALAKLGRTWELLLIASPGSDGVADRLAVLASKMQHVRQLASPPEPGVGSALRTIVAVAQYPILGFATTDYPYSPNDLPRMLHEFGRKETIYDREFEVVLVNGCRSGVPVPGFWKAIGFGVRGFARIALGLPMERLSGWLGWREHARSWWCWLVYGNPFHDPQCGFKLIRKSLIESFPIQSDGDFVHVEVIGKTTFLTNLTAEVILTATVTPVPRPSWSSVDRRRVFRHPEFRHPKPAPAG